MVQKVAHVGTVEKQATFPEIVGAPPKGAKEERTEMKMEKEKAKTLKEP